MNKKKIIWGIVILIFFATIVWIDIPYIFPTKNLMSKTNYDYTYKQVRAFDYTYILENETDSDLLDNFTWIDNTKDGEVDKLVSIIDELSCKKARRPKDSSKYSLEFVASYDEDEYATYTEGVFYITFYGDNIIGFQEQGQYKEKYYKILDKDFDIKKIMEELK
ncbi:MAG: hypothetical protein E7215_07660 [Clostridium sulfidigenes]|uniref:Uncharacterized protein n=1 Tax=Clostridium sulfidigenes TaxID=318464 RepID=A0A927W820_9CLOT|nr:hypothetical protein [Clostridium sulfidigenes]